MERKCCLKEALKRVEAAKQLQDPLESMKPFRSYERNGLRVSIDCKWTLDVDEFQWAFNLTKTNMKKMYNESEWRWNDREKRREMQDSSARYLLARSLDDKKLLAFVHFRYDIDDDVEVVYCYELQLEEAAQRKGLGKMLMQILELLAFQSRMKKVVVTVFKHNNAAISFYIEKMKYSVDVTSPSVCGLENCTYEILSKWIRKKTI